MAERALRHHLSRLANHSPHANGPNRISDTPICLPQQAGIRSRFQLQAQGFAWMQMTSEGHTSPSPIRKQGKASRLRTSNPPSPSKVNTQHSRILRRNTCSSVAIHGLERRLPQIQLKMSRANEASRFFLPSQGKKRRYTPTFSHRVA